MCSEKNTLSEAIILHKNIKILCHFAYSNLKPVIINNHHQEQKKEYKLLQGLKANPFPI